MRMTHYTTTAGCFTKQEYHIIATIGRDNTSYVWRAKIPVERKHVEATNANLERGSKQRVEAGRTGGADAGGWMGVGREQKCKGSKRERKEKERERRRKREKRGGTER